MQTQNGTQQVQRRRDALTAELRALVPDMQRRAVALDATAGFPVTDIEALRRLGALAAPVPADFGGLGMGTDPEGAPDLLRALRLIGRGSLAVGRIFEGHLNAIRLVVRHGSDAQARRVAEAALAGHLFGLWVTDAPGTVLQLTPQCVLRGAKSPCSGAGHATRALVTALDVAGEARMLVIDLVPGERVDRTGWDPHGMRATGSHRMALDGIAVAADAVIGAPGDYLRQPDFSAGAWRTSAVTLGGLEALVAAAARALVERGRQDDPHQRARFGEALIAQQTAQLWLGSAAKLAEANAGEADDVANYVNLARLAVEAACLDAVRLVQRALGLAAFRRGTLTELLFRDLAMYLRQPAPDITLTEAAGHFLRRDLPTPAA